MKTNKSYSKRLRVTLTGKIMARPKGQNHFNAKQSGQSKIAKGRSVTIQMSNKDKSRYLPGSF